MNVRSFVQVVAHAVGVQFRKFGIGSFAQLAHVGCYDAIKYNTMVSFVSKPTFLVTYILLFMRSTDINYALACDTWAFHKSFIYCGCNCATLGAPKESLHCIHDLFQFMTALHALFRPPLGRRFTLHNAARPLPV